MNQSQQNDIPIQPVEQPILCSPYDEPDLHWIYDTSTGEAVKNPGRREAGYWYKTQRTGSASTESLSRGGTRRSAVGERATCRCETMA